MQAAISTFRPVGRLAGRALVAALALAATIPAATAQGYDCDQLRARIAAAPTGNQAQGARYSAAIQKQEYELNRTASYAQSIGCNNRQFLFFGSAPPAQCGGIEARVRQMQSNLSSLRAQASAASGGERQALLARYDSSCRGGRGGLFDSLFGGRRDGPLDQMPLGPDGDIRQAEDDRARGGSEAVCVRTCDGGYFPISYSARRGNLDTLQELCKAQCPGAETALYTMPPAGDIDKAVSIDGDAYEDMPNAGKFRKTFDSTCSCKPPNQSWVQALAQAEELLGRKFKSDVVVTPEKSVELSRPKPAAAAPSTGVPADPAPAARTGPAARYGLDDGVTSEIPAGSNTKRKIRVIAPKL